MTEEKDSKKRTERERSSMYPYYGIQECVEFIRVVDKLGGKSGASPQSVLSAMGLQHLNSKPFTAKVSSSKQFGLLAKSGDSLQLTERGRLILYPTGGEKQIKTLLLEAFRSAPLYAKLVKRFDGRILPEKEAFSNILLSDFGIVKVLKDRAAKIFLTSAKYVGVLDKDNKLVVTGAGVAEEEQANLSLEGKPEDVPGLIQIPVLLADDRLAKISVPKDLSPADISKIEKVLSAHFS